MEERPLTIVRPARPNDVSKLSEFFLEAWREAGPAALGFAGATDEAVKEIASEEFLRKRLATPTIQMTVAEENRKVVGLASLRRVEQRVAELSAIVVLERAKGRGVGSRLLRKALEGARRRGFGSVVVKTEAANERAISFFRKAGFTESGKAVGRIGGTNVPVRVMARKLR